MCVHLNAIVSCHKAEATTIQQLLYPTFVNALNNLAFTGKLTSAKLTCFCLDRVKSKMGLFL